MPNNFEKYPGSVHYITKYKNEDLSSLSDEILDNMIEAIYNTANNKLDVITLASTLISERNARKSIKIEKKANRNLLFTIIPSVVALIIAGISLYFSFRDNIDDTKWQDNQMKSYNEQIISLKEIINIQKQYINELKILNEQKLPEIINKLE